MSVGRRYFRHRRAWSPRLWPFAAITATLDVLVLQLTHVRALWLVLLLSFVLGFGAVLRWEVWKRRHPVITPEQWLDDQRRVARWN
jgi:hypothetical protein